MDLIYILETASFADAEAREECERRIRAVIAERDEERALRMKLSDDYAFGKYADNDEKIEMKRRAEAAEARAAELEKALAPFAKAGELFADLPVSGYDLLIYRPAAGDKYSIHGNDLRRARSALARKGEG